MEPKDDDVSLEEDEGSGGDDGESDSIADNDTTDQEWKKADFLSFGNNSSEERDNDEGDEVDDDYSADGSQVKLRTPTKNSKDAKERSNSDRTSVYTGRQATDLGSYPTSLTEPAPWQTLLSELQGGNNKKNKNSPRQRYDRRNLPLPLVALHNEIVEFCYLMEPQPHEKLERERLIKQVVTLVEETFGSAAYNSGDNDTGDGSDEITNVHAECKCRVQVFGSQATGLYLPSSDIDLVVQLPEAQAENSEVNREEREKKSETTENSLKRKRDQDEYEEDGEASDDGNDGNDDNDDMKAPRAEKSKESHRAKKRKEQEEMEAFSKDIQSGNASKLHKEKVSRMRASSSSASQISIYQQFANTLRQYHLASCSNPKRKKSKTNAEANQSEDIDFRLSYLEVVENTRVPVVKFTHAATNISVDVCFNESGGPEAAEYMNQCQKDLPFLRPLVFVLKYFLACRGMNETYTGGMGSFLLQLLLLSYAQQRRREESNSGKYSSLYRPEVQANLGAMLMEFLELFGMDFNYLTTGISVRYGGYFFPKGASDKASIFLHQQQNNKDGSTRAFLAAVEHPLETTLDVGRGSYRIGLLQRAFETAFRTLLAHTSNPAVPTSSILGTILPPTEEMWKRRRDLISRSRSLKSSPKAQLKMR